MGMMMWLWQRLGVLAGLKKVVGYCSEYGVMSSFRFARLLLGTFRKWKALDVSN